MVKKGTDIAAPATATAIVQETIGYNNYVDAAIPKPISSVPAPALARVVFQGAGLGGLPSMQK